MVVICSKSGARWAHFHPSEVNIERTTKGYSREDKEDPASEIQFCANCGSTTHFNLTTSAIAEFGNVQTGANMRLMDERGLPRRFLHRFDHIIDRFDLPFAFEPFSLQAGWHPRFDNDLGHQWLREQLMAVIR
ncbi:MAG: hypothetical protein ACP5QR_16785 [Rhizomicrobium sp.]